MLAVVRLRGGISLNSRQKSTMKMLGLKRVNSLSLVSESAIGMLKKVENFVTWGEINNDVLNDLMKGNKNKFNFRLSPPRKGYRSIKKMYPRGDLGYRGERINDLIKRMV